MEHVRWLAEPQLQRPTVIAAFRPEVEERLLASSPESITNTVAMLNKYPDRFLFGTDNVAPADQPAQLRVYDLWDPIWKQLTPEASRKVRLGNYERLFDAARVKVRAWEATNVK